MTTGFKNSRRWIVAMVIATVVTMTVTYGAVLLEQVASIEAGTPVMACSHSTSGGDC